ncbi:MAG: tetratricopeptide repeat protein [Candidatus Edwardsbacteria bacterium]|nr:tetratricopeptide repeat protein [Candidatus Edwardsbacteria bacterium]MBU1575809.1 tetratricopeptide repeat protein [Candidatus Edwardsbacteria bacterium]MBU2463974.1 tetratricopeptide repeat protein [Candidatus Edwardsbacteria bacterium]MBU2593270.1 tetratricopeptide repeat protein [Candidatus Edwardsbacteria bacterium]
MATPQYKLKNLWLQAGESYYAYTVYLRKAEVLDLAGEWQESVRLLTNNYEFAKIAGAKKETADSEVKRIRLLRYLGKTQDFLVPLKKARAIYKKLGDEGGLNQVTNEIGLAYRFSGDNRKAEDCFCLLIDRAEKSGGLKHLMSGLGNLSQIYMQQGKHDLALEYLNRCMDISLRQNDNTFLTILYGSMGNTYFYQDRLDLAMEHYQKQFHSATKFGDIANISVAVGNIGNIHNRHGDFARALECYREKLDLSQKLGYKIGILQALGNMGLALTELGDMTEAQGCFERQLAVSREANDPEGIEGACSGLGEIFTQLADYTRAEEYFKLAIAVDIEHGLRNDLAVDYLGLAEMYLKKGDAGLAREAASLALVAAREIGDDELVAKAARLQKQRTDV